MAPSSWNTLRATNRTGRGSASEQEKENHQRYTAQRPSSKADSIALVSDSEPEGEVDAKGRPLSKGSNSGIRSQISRALSPAAYYVRERSRDPEESNQSLHIPRSFSRESSYDYTTEQAHYEAQLAKAKARRASQEPPDNSIETSFEGAASKSNSKKHRSRISLDNQAWKPGKDDFDEDEDYDSGSGKKRRKKKKKEDGAGRLTNLPTVNYGKKRKGRKSGAGPETIEEVDETSFGNETSEMVAEDFIVSLTELVW
jgi:SUN domain-containing protein 1/2